MGARFRRPPLSKKNFPRQSLFLRGESQSHRGAYVRSAPRPWDVFASTFRSARTPLLPEMLSLVQGSVNVSRVIPHGLRPGR